MKLETCQCFAPHAEIVEKLIKDVPQISSFDLISSLFKAFADTTRLRIVYILFENDLCVCDITQILGLSQSNVSHQLAYLKAHNLVKSRKLGKQVIYSLADNHVKTIFAQASEHIKEL